MSEPVSALGGASYDGLVSISDAGPRGMITVRGDLASVDLKNAVTGLAGVDFPGQRGANSVGERGILWMSPDELMLLVPYAEAAEVEAVVAKALKSEHHLVANVSDARCLFEISGPRVRAVLAKLTPADLHPTSLGPGEVRRTRLAQVPAAFWLQDEETAQLICFRSVAAYVFDLLAIASRPGTDNDLF